MATEFKFWLYQAFSSTLKMGDGSFLETLENFPTLWRLSAREGFIVQYDNSSEHIMCCT